MEAKPDGGLVEDVMAPKVVTIDGGATAEEGASLMANSKCGCLVVVRGGTALGIVTERDMVRKILAVGADPSKVLVSDVMSTPLIQIGPKAEVVEAAEKMSEYLVRRLVVVDETGTLVGLITASDIAKELARRQEYNDSALNALARMKRGGTGGPYE